LELSTESWSIIAAPGSLLTGSSEGSGVIGNAELLVELDVNGGTGGLEGAQQELAYNKAKATNAALSALSMRYLGDLVEVFIVACRIVSIMLPLYQYLISLSG
jgi:hypothetical protein